ncbi:hypothetical protein Tco_0874942 [Tanacetum coccineum]|uniref:Uncharacterized protein n=1 Tax=Tanacetum coccineum TaxID=301880 RepID=A0ABQ5BN28_9ASTR
MNCIVASIYKARVQIPKKIRLGAYLSNISEAIGNSGGILYTWDPNIFLNEQHILSDNFVALFARSLPTLLWNHPLASKMSKLDHFLVTEVGFEQLGDSYYRNYNVLEDSNGMVRFKKKLQALKKAIREFHAQSGIRNKINFLFPNQLSSDQAVEFEKQVSTDEIRTTVWACGETITWARMGLRSNIPILGSLSSGMASVLSTEVPNTEFQFHCG